MGTPENIVYYIFKRLDPYIESIRNPVVIQNWELEVESFLDAYDDLKNDMILNRIERCGK